MALPPKRNKLRAWPFIIIGVGLVCIAGFAILVGAVLFMRSKVVTARETDSQPAAAPEAKARPVVASTGRAGKSEPGVTYRNDRVASVPWSIHVLKIDRSQKDLIFYAAHARDKVLGVSFLTDQARSVPREIGRAVAGINGDFYLRDTPPYTGDPRGLQILNGDLISAPDTVCVWFDADGNPHLDEVKGDFNVTWANGHKIPFGLNERRSSSKAVLYTPSYGASTLARGGIELILENDGAGPWLPLRASQTYRARVRDISTNGNTRLATNIMVLSLAPQLLANVPQPSVGAVVQISTATTPDLTGVQAAIGGGPTLIKEGKPAFSVKSPPPGTSREWRERSKYERHPRAAVGWSQTHLYLLVVDGRQPGLSAGMKLAELADYMVELGCTEAMNMDGGKSAQMWLSGQIVNDPCQGVDTVANSLFVVRKTETP